MKAKKTKRIIASLLTTCIICTGICSVSVVASSIYNFSFSLSSGAIRNTSEEDTNGSNVGKINVTSSFYNGDFANARFYTGNTAVSNIGQLASSGVLYSFPYTSSPSSAKARIMNNQNSKTITGFWSPSGYVE